MPVADGDRINFGGVLEFQTSIFTNGERILGVLLKRTQNLSNINYILARGPIPIGSRRGLPIALPRNPEICGFIVFDPCERDWRFCPGNALMGGRDGVRLAGTNPLLIGNLNLTFIEGK